MSGLQNSIVPNRLSSIQNILKNNSIITISIVIFIVAIILISIGLSVNQLVVGQTGWVFGALGVFLLALKTIEQAFNSLPNDSTTNQLDFLKKKQKSFRFFLVSVILSWIPTGFMYVILFNKKINYIIQDNDKSLEGKITDNSKVSDSEMAVFKTYISVLYFLTLSVLLATMVAMLTNNIKIMKIAGIAPLITIAISIIICIIVYRGMVVKMRSYTTDH